MHVGEPAVVGLFKEWKIYDEKEIPWAISAPLQTLTELDA
jgi:hypothetical protein